MIKNRKEIAGSDQKAVFCHCEHRNTGEYGEYGRIRANTGEYGRIRGHITYLILAIEKITAESEIRGHITYLILAIEKITAERNGYVNELSYVSPDSPEKENNEFEICD